MVSTNQPSPVVLLGNNKMVSKTQFTNKTLLIGVPVHDLKGKKDENSDSQSTRTLVVIVCK